jgi:carbamoyl-phosphate synthase large subunit
MGDADMNDKSLRVLITACGAPGAPGIIKSLRRNGERSVWLFGTDMSEHAIGFAMVDQWQIVPSGQQSRAFIAAMLEIVRKHAIDVMLPLSTYELLPLADAREQFKALGARVMVSPAHGLVIANNKAKLFARFANQTWVPQHRAVQSLPAFIEAVHDLGFPRLPVCFKPAVSKGSRGFRILDKQANSLDRLLNWKPDGTRTNLDSMLEVLKETESFPEFLVMEYLPGLEYSVDTLVANDTMLLAIPRSRDEIRLGICFRGRAENNPELIELSRYVVEELGLAYNINLQFRYDREGRPKLLEINPRVSGTIVLCTGAGVNMPYLGLKLALNEPFSIPLVRWGTSMTRYWEEMFYDADGSAYTFDLL